MNSAGTELNSTQRDNVDPEDPSVTEKDAHVHPAGTAVWVGAPPAISLPGAGPPPQQHGLQTVMVDPLSLGFHCSCQYSQCQTDPEYLTSSQYPLLPGPARGSSDSSHVSSVSAPWFTYEPVLCSMMPGDILSPVAGLFVPQAVDLQQFQRGLTEFTPHYSQPVLCNVAAGGQDALVNPCEPGPVFHTLKPAPTHTDGSSPQGRRQEHFTYNVSVSGTSGQYQQTAQTLDEYCDQTPSLQSQPPPARTFGNRKPCHCTRSQCLKFYCECFANGLMCNNCDCSNCFNNAEHVMIRQKAIEIRSGRNPDAFRTKIVGGRSDVKGWHNKGCSCKRSGCLKNYCECYEANVMCTSSCKCNGCRNFDDSSTMGPKKKAVRVKDRCPDSVITLCVVEAVCGCLMAQAQKAERETPSAARAEQKVLEEFGHCLTQIVRAMFKSNTH